MPLLDTKTQITEARVTPADIAVDGPSVVDMLNEMAVNLDALYVTLGSLDLRQHCPEIASISSRLAIVRDAVKAAVPAEKPLEP